MVDSPRTLSFWLMKLEQPMKLKKSQANTAPPAPPRPPADGTASVGSSTLSSRTAVSRPSVDASDKATTASGLSPRSLRSASIISGSSATSGSDLPPIVLHADEVDWDNLPLDYEAMLASGDSTNSVTSRSLLNQGNVKVSTVPRSYTTSSTPGPSNPPEDAPKHVAAILDTLTRDWTVVSRPGVIHAKPSSRPTVATPTASLASAASAGFRPPVGASAGSSSRGSWKNSWKGGRSRASSAAAAAAAHASSKDGDKAKPSAPPAPSAKNAHSDLPELKYDIDTVVPSKMPTSTPSLVNAKPPAPTPPPHSLPLLQLYCDPDGDYKTTDPRLEPKIPSAAPGRHVLVDFKDISFTVGEIEPVFASAAIYDIRTRQRLSDTFSFHLNSSPILAFLGDRRPKDPVDQAYRARRVVFSLHEPSPDVYLVIRLFRSLSGDFDSVADAYAKDLSGDKLKDHREKLRAKARDSVARLGAFRQALAWTAVPLFDDKGDLIPGPAAKLGPLWRPSRGDTADDFVFDFLAENSGKATTGKSGRLKTIPGRVIADVSTVESLAAVPRAPRLLNSSLEDMPLSAALPDVEGEPTRLVVASRCFAKPREPVASTEFENLLYVYPETVSFQAYPKGSARNIAVKLTLVPEEGTLPLAAFYPPPPGAQGLVTHVTTAVTYHSKTPHWADDFKISLPLNMTSKCHILFTFYHVSCKEEKRSRSNSNASSASGGSGEDVETAIGYSVLPISSHGRVVDDELLLPVLLGSPIPGYQAAALAGPQGTARGFAWLDSGKPLFRVRTKLASSVYSSDPALSTFLMSSAAPNPAAGSLSNMRLLPSVRPQEAISFAHVILNAALAELAAAPDDTTALATLLSISRTMSNMMVLAPSARTTVFAPYIHFAYKPLNRDSIPIHDPLVSAWVTLLREKYEGPQAPGPVAPAPTSPTSSRSSVSNTSSSSVATTAPLGKGPEKVSGAVDDIVKHSSIFFGIIAKSLVLDAHNRGNLSGANRSGRFSPAIMRSMKMLMYYLTLEVQRRSKTGLNVAKDLNRSMALFLRDILAVVDRGHVLDIVHRYLCMIAPNDSEVLLEFKFDFLRLVGGYEHWIALNLPTPDALTAPTPGSLEDRLNAKHYLVGLLLKETLAAASHNEKSIRSTAFGVLRGVLTRHEHDPKLSSKEVKASVSSVYLSLMMSMIGPSAEAYWSTTDSDERRSLFASVLYVLKNLAPRTLRSWWRTETAPRRAVFLRLLTTMLRAFNYPGRSALVDKAAEASTSTQRSADAKSALEQMYANMMPGSARRSHRTGSNATNGGDDGGSKALASASAAYVAGTSSSSASSSGSINSMRAARFTRGASVHSASGSVGGSTGSNTSSRHHKHAVHKHGGHHSSHAASSSMQVHHSARERHVALIPKAEGHLSADAACVIIETLLQFMDEFGADLAKTKLADVTPPAENSILGNTGMEPQNMLEALLEVWLVMFECNLSEPVLSYAFSAVRTVLVKYPVAVFTEENGFCRELCAHVLRICASRSGPARLEGAGMLYVLLRSNFEACGMFARVKAQATIALSRLVAKDNGLKDDTELREALEAVRKFATSDKGVVKQFGTQVGELMDRFVTILADSVAMQASREDPELTGDLYVRIAKSYTNTPDLRLTWLSSLAKFHTERGNHAEAGITWIHVAAAAAEYAGKRGALTNLPSHAIKAASSLAVVTPTVAEEKASAEVSLDQSELFQGRFFTRAGLAEVLEKAAASFTSAELFEMAADSIKAVVPLYEAEQNWSSLSKAHRFLAVMYDKTAEANVPGTTRLLGSYYRVGFYGKAFGDLNGTEWIYKEPKITHLYELKDRLIAHYNKVTKKTVTVFKDSSDVDTSKLDPNVPQLQITAVEPWFEAQPESKINRLTHLSKFVFETPFTENGKAQAENVGEQFLRKTILGMDGGFEFPYMTKRLRVSSRKQFVLKPLEVAAERLASRNQRMREAVCEQPVNTKTLQSLLQGSIALQVNAGPIELCRVFLGYQDKWDKKALATLRDEMTEFLDANRAALEANRAACGPAGQPMAEHLANMYDKIKTQVEPFLAPEGPPRELVEQLEKDMREKARSEEKAAAARKAAEGLAINRRGAAAGAAQEESSLDDLLEFLGPEGVEEMKKRKEGDPTAAAGGKDDLQDILQYLSSV